MNLVKRFSVILELFSTEVISLKLKVNISVVQSQGTSYTTERTCIKCNFTSTRHQALSKGLENIIQALWIILQLYFSDLQLSMFYVITVSQHSVAAL